MSKIEVNFAKLENLNLLIKNLRIIEVRLEQELYPDKYKNDILAAEREVRKEISKISNAQTEEDYYKVINELLEFLKLGPELFKAKARFEPVNETEPSHLRERLFKLVSVLECDKIDPEYLKMYCDNILELLDTLEIKGRCKQLIKDIEAAKVPEIYRRNLLIVIHNDKM